MTRTARKTTAKQSEQERGKDESGAEVEVPAATPRAKTEKVTGVSAHYAFSGSPMDVVMGMRKGAPAAVVPDLALRLGISQEKLFESLNLPKSTLKGRISKGQPLAPVEQDRIYRADRVLARARQVLGDEKAAQEWMNQRNRSLGGEAPLALLDTEAGYELVLDTLGRIEYGVFS